MTPLDITHIALVVVAGLAVLLWLIPGPCVCAQCDFHVNEKRVARLRQKELEHDTEHKGFGFREGTPDRHDCMDETCPRNKLHSES